MTIPNKIKMRKWKKNRASRTGHTDLSSVSNFASDLNLMFLNAIDMHREPDQGKMLNKAQQRD